MKIGISTYAFFWQLSEMAPRRITLKEMISQTREYGGDVFQICDYPLIEEMNENELKEIASYAKSLNIELEIGTRGIHPSILYKYLSLAKVLDVKMVRSMVHSNEYKPDFDESIKWLNQVIPQFQEENVVLTLETYEQIGTDSLVDIVKNINNPYLGICLDPANTIASLELPKNVIQKTAPFVMNLHVKDFHFTRNDGWVGFNLTGCSLGEGQLEFSYMLEQIQANQHQPNAILEFWLNFTDSIEATIQLEKEWIKNSMEFLRRKIYVINS